MTNKVQSDNVERSNAQETDEYIKIWKDEGDLRAGFFSNEAVLMEEIPIGDCNSDNADDLAKELDEAFSAHKIRFGAGVNPDQKTLEEMKE